MSSVKQLEKEYSEAFNLYLSRLLSSGVDGNTALEYADNLAKSAASNAVWQQITVDAGESIPSISDDVKEALHQYSSAGTNEVLNSPLRRIANPEAFESGDFIGGFVDGVSQLASNKGLQMIASAAITGGMMNGGLSSFGLGGELTQSGMLAAQNAGLVGADVLTSQALLANMPVAQQAALTAQGLAAQGLGESAISSALASAGFSPDIAMVAAQDAAMGAIGSGVGMSFGTPNSGGGLMDTIAKTAGNKLQDPTTWGGVLNNLANVAGGAYLANQSSSLFGDLAKQSAALGQDYANKIGSAGADAASKAQFKPYTVTSGLGGTSVTPEGLSYNLSPQQQAITDSLMSQAQNMASKDAYVSPEGLFSTLQAMSDPVNARKRLAMENRLSAQGRLGTATAAYGGTPEQLAMEIAMQEQLAKTAWQSQIGAGELTGRNLTNQGTALATAYKPYDQMQGMMTQALQGQKLAQNVGNTQAEIAYKTALAQAAAALEGQKTAMGYNIMGSMQNLGMMQQMLGSNPKTGQNNLIGAISGIGGLFGGTNLGAGSSNPISNSDWWSLMGGQ